MKKVGPLRGNPIVHRFPGNPVLKSSDVPYPSKLVYNAGVVKRDGRYVCVFRSDSGWDGEKKKAPQFDLGLAYSENGVTWRVEPEKLHPCDDPDIRGNTDPHLTFLEGRYFITYCQFTGHGNRAVIAATEDFKTFDIFDRTAPDNRDMVLFPERISGRYYRLERPFPIDSRDGQRQFDIWISESPDLVY